MKFTNQISYNKNTLVILGDYAGSNREIDDLKQHFCGKVEDHLPLEAVGKIYICGNLSSVSNEARGLYIIEDLSMHIDHLAATNKMVHLGQVPIVIHSAGVYFRNYFGNHQWFDRIKSSHEFQELTESNKQSKAFRKGIYLSRVEGNSEELHFHLLRCSSNLTGPTDNFREADRLVMEGLNNAASEVFEIAPRLNHVLAQIYENRSRENGTSKEYKAKIKAHSDKTKDMSKDGIIAFTTFYDRIDEDQLRRSDKDMFDWCYKATSGLTRLQFKLKNTVTDESLIKEFSITLYPNSVFMIPLSTNRLYTHEIKPSALNVERIPTRMGYVARCSDLEAVYRNSQTFIRHDDDLIPLTKMTPEMMESLRDSYREENKTEKMVKYGEILFSMNAGDYMKPIL